jgi:hypothetical protein
MFLHFKDIKILSDTNYQKVPLECPLCNFLLTTADILVYKKNECCDFCSMMVVDPNKERWENGWRPSKKEMSKVIKNRKKIPSYIMRGL